MRVAYTDFNVGYLPPPNRVEVVLTDEVAPFELTRTAFMLPMFRDGSFLLAHNQRRGLEIPGGHVDPGETLLQAALRECDEEVGASVISVVPLGYLKMISSGPTPKDWSYPHPISYQQFYTGIVDGQRIYTANDECAEPVRIIDIADARIKRKTIRIFVEAARAL